MKNISLILSIIIAIAFTSCENNNGNISTDVVNNSKSAAGEVGNSEAPVMTFEQVEHDFGKIIQGEKVSYNFKFTNTGKSALLISRVSTTCGCTVGEYPKIPVKSGETEYIEVTFDSKHKSGFQNKAITILANTQPNKTTLRVKGQVVLPQNN
ncbi:MAG: hypothetical protein C0598_11185 [Marinilabiliales bacterium]|nr:MAG: hypothetical protein C0598_11185 [Marinilabiliales bacterium]